MNTDIVSGFVSWFGGVLKGDFFYEITETGTYAGFNNGQSNSQKFYAQVHVDDNRVGDLNTRIYYYDNVSNVGDTTKAMPTAPIFQNEYKASSNATINVAKHIEGRTWKSNDTFDFTLSIQGPGPMPTGTDADKLTIRYSNTTSPAEDNIDRTGSYTFNVPLDALTNTTTATSNLKYSDGTTPVPAGVKYNTFTYRLDEQANGATDLNYQTAPVYVKIVAIDKLNGTIDLNTTYHTAMPCTDANKINANIATFTNTYFHDLKIPVKKTVFGNSAPEQEYTFTLTDSDGVVRSTKTVMADANGNNNKTVEFDPVTFTLADAGADEAQANTFTYTIAETAGSNELFQYATGTITATVKVYKDANGNLQVEPTYEPTAGKTDGVSVTDNEATPTFTNTYIQNDTARLYIYKEVIGRQWDTDEFTFTVRAINGGHAPQAATATIRSSDPHHEVEDDVVIRAKDFTGEATVAEGKKTQDFIYEIAERLTSTQQQNYISRAPVYAKVTATLDDGVDGSVHVTGVTYWHDEACTIAADTQTETVGETSTIAVKFTNWNNATVAPALNVGKVIQNQEGSTFTWAIDDSFNFSVLPVSSNVPGFGEMETVAATSINNTNNPYSYNSNSGYQKTCVLSLSMADLQRNDKNAPTTTKFIYQIVEDVPTQGAISGIGYTSNSVYAEVTATPTDEGTLSTTVSYYKNYDSSTGTLTNIIEDTNAAPFTNTFGAVNFSVNKIWRDGGASDRPNEGKITLHLAQTVEGETTTLEALPGKGQVAINGGADKTAD